MVSKLYEKVNYLANVNNIINNYITEYDIAKANINVLYREKAISKDQYDYYYNLPKLQREIEIGLLQREIPRMSKILKDGIIKAKKEFFEANNIQDHQVLAIKNDAVYIIGINKALFTVFDNIEFKSKNIYTSYYHIDKTEMYYFNNMISNVEKIDVKGISDNALEYHRNYFLEFLLTVFDMAQKEPVVEVLEFINAFYTNYMTLSLDIEYYREFNNESLFLLKSDSEYSVFKARCIDKSKKQFIDISYNAYFIRKLYQIFSSIHFAKR